MGQDIRFALRMVLAHRWFSLAVVATLALGIGLNTMVFTIIDAALFKPVPVPGGERLVTITCRDLKNPNNQQNRMGVSWPDFNDYRAHTNSLEALEAATEDGVTLSEQSVAPDHYGLLRVSPGFFTMLRIAPVRGRDFTATEAAPVVIIGHSVWKKRYGGQDVLGRVVRVNGKQATIVGVMPAGFRFPRQQDLWMPLDAGADLTNRALRPLQLFGIRKRGTSLRQAAAEFDVLSRQLAGEYPKENQDVGAIVETFHERYNGGPIRIVFSLMMAAVALVLLIACANVANMMLGRALGRRREISIRAALGASRWQLVRQLLIESLMLSLLGGVVGLSLCAFGVHAFDLATQDVGKPYWVQFAMDYRVFGFFAAACILSALLFGLAPALRSSRPDVNGALKENSRAAGSQRGGRLSGALVIFQFALTLVLLLGAGVFMRTFIDKQTVNPWLPADRMMTGRIDLPVERYPDSDARRRFFDRLMPRLAAIPGVEAAAMASDLPGAGARSLEIEIEGAPANSKRPTARSIEQSPGYLAAINLPLLRGRDFNSSDGGDGQHNAVVTRDFASHFWGSRDPMGKRFRIFSKGKAGEWISIIGVSADIEPGPDQDDSDPLLFLPYREDSYGSMCVVARASNTASTGAEMRTALQSLDQDLPLFDLRTMWQGMERQIWFLRLFGTIFLVFASIAMAMASVGIYAVMAQATGSRTREIGVRMALGATSAGILALVLRRGVWQLSAGLGLGLAAAVPAARALGSLGFLEAPSDPAMVGAVGALLAFVGLFACWLPARRAAGLNPVSAIRDE